MQKNDDNKEPEQQKIPKGFEKFFKKKESGTKVEEKSEGKESQSSPKKEQS